MLVKNLQPVYHEKLFYQSITTFGELIEIGSRIKDAIRKGKFKKDDPQRRSVQSICPQNLHDVNALTPQSYSNQWKVKLLRQGRYQSTTSIRSNQPGPNCGPKREQKTPVNLGIPLSLALERMLKSGHLKRMDPKPVPDPLPPGYNMNQYCAYHQIPGRDTDHCMRLKHEIRVLIENEIIKLDEFEEA